MVKLSNKYVELWNATCRQFYWAEIKGVREIPRCYFKWESEYFFANFDLDLINIIPYECTSDTHLQTLQYKIITDTSHVYTNITHGILKIVISALIVRKSVLYITIL